VLALDFGGLSQTQSLCYSAEAAMIPELETERMWLRPVRLEDAEQTQTLFPVKVGLRLARI
jgi:hypothetical protein